MNDGDQIVSLVARHGIALMSSIFDPTEWSYEWETITGKRVVTEPAIVQKWTECHRGPQANQGQGVAELEKLLDSLGQMALEREHVMSNVFFEREVLEMIDGLTFDLLSMVLAPADESSSSSSDHEDSDFDAAAARAPVPSTSPKATEKEYTEGMLNMGIVEGSDYVSQYDIWFERVARLLKQRYTDNASRMPVQQVRELSTLR